MSCECGHGRDYHGDCTGPCRRNDCTCRGFSPKRPTERSESRLSLRQHDELAAESHVDSPETRIARLEEAVETMAWWLVSAQTGFGQRDAERICDILRGQG